MASLFDFKNAFVFCIAISLGFAPTPLSKSMAWGQKKDTGSSVQNDLNVQQKSFTVSGFVRFKAQKPNEKVRVLVTFNTSEGRIPAKVEVTGRKFQVHIPTNLNYYTISFFATNESGSQQAARIISTSEFRQRSQNGLVLRLQEAKRSIQFKTTLKGKPVANVKVFCRMSSGVRMTQKTNEQGIAVFQCLPRLRLYQVTAWKDQALLGGYSLRGNPKRDPASNEHEIQLASTRARKVQFSDSQGNPVANTSFRLDVGTPAPFRNMMDADEIFTVKTDAQGESTVKWIPDLPELTFGVTTRQKNLEAQLKSLKLKDEAIQISLRKKTARKTIRGKLKSSFSEPLGGFNVILESYQGELANTKDVIRVFTNHDGSFEANVLPDATYCIYVNDLKWCSKPIHAILFDLQKNKAATPEISLVEGEKVEIVATQGPNKKPIPKLFVRVSSRYEFSWVEKGMQQSGNLSMTKSIQTDENGLAELYVRPGRVDVTARSGDWRFETKDKVIKGEAKTIRIDRQDK